MPCLLFTTLELTAVQFVLFVHRDTQLTRLRRFFRFRPFLDNGRLLGMCQPLLTSQGQKAKLQLRYLRLVFEDYRPPRTDRGSLDATGWSSFPS